jgi:hypothetical protein
VVQKVEISSQTEKIPQYPATPLSLESKIIAHSSAQTQLKQAQTTVESKISAASELDSDSGFASDSEDAENVRALHPLILFKLIMTEYRLRISQSQETHPT